ncbi:TlpA family protein disulfide reductase [Nitrospirota bacterium]
MHLIAGRKSILPIFLISSLIFLSLVAGCKDGGNGRQALVINGPAPAFDLVDTGGKSWRLSGLKGKVVLINFWATWCPSCVQEMPSIHNLNVLASGADNFQILTVLFQDSPEKAREYFMEEGFAMPILSDRDGIAARKYGLTGVPETFIIDKKGILRSKYIGPRNFDTPDMVQFLNRLLEEPS